MVSWGKFTEFDTVYLAEEVLMVVSDPLPDVNVQETDVAAGEADTVQGITTLFPVIAV